MSVNVSIEYLKNVLPIPLAEICKELNWNVYIDFDIDRILLSESESSPIYLGIEWNRNLPFYVFYKTHTEVKDKGRLKTYFKQSPNWTEDISEAIQCLKLEINPFEE
jgi:hypothetical protein